MEVLTEKKYYTYHTQNLVPTKLKINSEVFVKEISKFNFMPWGDVHLEFPRYAIPLVNEDGIFKEDDPACYPLDRWNFLLEYPQFKYKEWTDEHLIKWKEWNSREIDMDSIVNEKHFKVSTDALKISSLSALSELSPYMYRSCILKWDYLGHFKKHIDTWHPTQWIKLWGTTNPDGMVIRYEKDGKMVSESHIEQGRFYLHDSIKPHEGLAFADDVYQFFISLNPRALDVLW